MASFLDWRVPTDHSFSVAFEKEKCQNSAESKWLHSDKFCVVSDPDVWKVIRLIRRGFWSSSSLTLPKTNIAPPPPPQKKNGGFQVRNLQTSSKPLFPGGFHSLLVSGRVGNKNTSKIAFPPALVRKGDVVVVNADTPYAYQKLLEHTPSQADPMFVFCFFWIKVSIGVRVHCFLGGYMTCMGDTCIYYVYIYTYIYI